MNGDAAIGHNRPSADRDLAINGGAKVRTDPMPVRKGTRRMAISRIAWDAGDAG